MYDYILHYYLPNKATPSAVGFGLNSQVEEKTLNNKKNTLIMNK